MMHYNDMNLWFKLFYCPSEDNIADAFTKALPRPRLQKLRMMMSVACAQGGVLEYETERSEARGRSESRESEGSE
jgi:hypothetical protein